MAYKPPFQMTDEVVNLVSDISMAIGQLSEAEGLSKNPRLRRETRIRSIQSSLAIENNTLSVDEVTAVIDGKRVLAPPKDIREAQNAYEAYEALASLDPFSMDDLLKAHGFMMAGLVKDAGCFRSGDVGVFAGDALVHAGTPAAYVPGVMADLFQWLRETETHPLVASCVFHSEFEYIHPFSDGNGRTGRLWHSLLLRRWNQLFEWLPVETLVAEHQSGYYDALAAAQQEADCTPFVLFMLRVIKETIDEAYATQVRRVFAKSSNKSIDKSSDKTSVHRRAIIAFLKEHGSAKTNELASVIGLTPVGTRKVLAKMVEEGLIVAHGERRGRYYCLPNDGEDDGAGL